MKRRDLIKVGLGSIGTLWTLNSLGQSRVCGLTPPQTEGPFYPIEDQADTDADLTSIKGSSKIAAGRIVIIRGQVTDQFCNPVAGVLVEIWQACASGRYDHPSDPNPAPLDPHFQYWGKSVTDAQGFYQFRTIVPGSYPAADGWERPPHVHFKVTKKAYFELVTQMYFAGESLNEKDLILKSLPPSEQEKVVVSFIAEEGSSHPVGNFDISIRKVQT